VTDETAAEKRIEGAKIEAETSDRPGSGTGVFVAQQNPAVIGPDCALLNAEMKIKNGLQRILAMQTEVRTRSRAGTCA
jgi:hypothetical protein